MKYKYQIHTHTAPNSKCASTLPSELAKALHDAGFSGCVITNHFYHGNTGISRELCWEDFVRAYERDYIECKAEGEKYGLDIIFGVEEGIGGPNEILCYGLTPKMLYDHPELLDGGAEIWCRVLHELGVVIIQAHPFRGPCTPLPLDLIDGIEVYNHSHNQEYNDAAQRFAEEHPGLILTSGGDTHDPHNVPFAGIATDTRIRDGRDLCEVLRSGKYELLKS